MMLTYLIYALLAMIVFYIVFVASVSLWGFAVIVKELICKAFRRDNADG